jgi:hypothetical protein
MSKDRDGFHPGVLKFRSDEDGGGIPKNADDCRELAAKLRDPEDRRALELMAAAWDKVDKERETLLTSKPE